MARKVNVIVRGELFQRFKDLQSDFWATNLGDLKTYLELYLEEGGGQLPKEKMASLFEKAMPFETKSGKPPSQNELAKAVAGFAIICASSISAFVNAENHLAEFEAWTMYWGYVLAISERWDLPAKYLRFATDIALEAMYSSLGRLCDELMERKDYSEGDVLSDRPIYEVRMTHLLGLMGIYGLWSSKRVREGIEQADDRPTHFLRQFCLDRSKSLWLWGEYAVPQFLAHNFFRRTFDPTPATDRLYYSLIEAIVKLNGENDGPLANPYYAAEDYLPHIFKLEPEGLQDSFGRSSYYLEGLLHLFVRENWKQHLRWIFPSITKLGMRHYVPGNPWKFYFHRDKTGKNHHRIMQPPHKWSALREQAAEDRGEGLPERIRDHPIAYLSFLCVYPHRVNSSGLRWLSSRLLEES